MYMWCTYLCIPVRGYNLICDVRVSLAESGGGARKGILKKTRSEEGLLCNVPQHHDLVRLRDRLTFHCDAYALLNCSASDIYENPITCINMKLLLKTPKAHLFSKAEKYAILYSIY